MDTEIVIVDGFRIDTITGEVIGHVQDDHERFIADTPEKVEWVLEKISAVECEIAALEARRKALNDNLDQMIRRANRRYEWLQMRFNPDLRAFLERQIAGQKQKFWQSPFGRLCLRTTKGSVKVTDPNAALEWAQQHCREAIQIKRSVLVSKITDRENLPTSAFEVSGPEERMYIDTGADYAKNSQAEDRT